MGDKERVIRKRATGTREQVVAFLTGTGGEIYDKDGMASRTLAEAVGYPGTSIAFAQLLSGMERAGVISREVRGKRTYRIRLGDFDGFGPVRQGRGESGGAGLAPAAVSLPQGSDFDYDELARRLLIQVVRRLAEPPPEPEQTHAIASLEHELASAWSKHGRLAEENVRLREQLRAAQQSLARARERVRRVPVSAGLDSSEVMLLRRLLAAEPEDAPRGTIAGW